MEQQRRNCCVKGSREGCQNFDRPDVVITLGNREVNRVPLYCFLEKLSPVIERDKDYETCIPGLKFLTGGIAGRLDLDKCAKAGTMVVRIQLGKIFGGAIREYFFPSTMGEEKITYLGALRGAFDEEEDSEELKEAVI